MISLLLLSSPHLFVLPGGVRKGEVLFLSEGPQTVPSDFCPIHVADKGVCPTWVPSRAGVCGGEREPESEAITRPLQSCNLFMSQ